MKQVLVSLNEKNEMAVNAQGVGDLFDVLDVLIRAQHAVLADIRAKAAAAAPKVVPVPAAALLTMPNGARPNG